MKIIFWTFLLSLCLPFGMVGQGDAIRLQLKWLHQFQFAGYYAAIEKGYYEEEGLSVELIEPQINEDPMEAVLEGRADFGVCTSDILKLRAEGEPVVALAVIYQHSPYVFVSDYDEEIETLHDLVGRKVMMEPNSADLLAMLRAEMIDIDQIHFIPHTFAVDDLLEGKVAAMSAYLTDEPYAIKMANKRPIIFTPRMSGIDFYGDGLFTTEETIRKNPDQVDRFLRASLRGWEYALQHPEEIVDLILEKYSTRKTRDQLLFEAHRTIDLVRPDLVEIGYMNPGRWKSILQIFQSVGLVENNVDLEKMLYKTGLAMPWRRVIAIFSGILGVLLVVSFVALQLYRGKRKMAEEVRLRRQSEAILSELEERYRNIFYGAPMAFLIFDCDGKIKEWNHEAERIFGWKRDEVIGLNFRNIIIPEDEGDRVEAAVSQIIGKGAFSMSNWNLQKSGNRIWCKWHSVGRWNDQNEFLECHSIAADMTKEKEMEIGLRQAKVVAESMNQEKGRALAQVSHEIRNPLNAIIGCSSLLRDEIENSELKDLVDIVQSSAESLVDLLNDILDFSKIEAGRLEMVQEEIAPFDIITRCVELYRASAKAKGLRLEFISEWAADERLTTDPMRLSQILRNFLSNAINFTPTGEVMVESKWVEDKEMGTCFCLSVKDTGVGIAEEDMKALFQPYSQGKATAFVVGGTGLGLALCEQLARLLGGRIEVKSEIKKGSEFSVLLPRCPISE